MSHIAQPRRRDILLTLAAASFCLPDRAGAEIVIDEDYRRLPRAQPRVVTAGIEVIEFFSYGCEACFRFHPLVTQWIQAQRPDVAFVRVPYSIGRPKWAALVPAFYALRECGVLDRFDRAMFDAIHVHRIPLFDEAAITDWVAQNGVDAATFSHALHSPNVLNQARRAEQMGLDYRIVGIPALVVNGQFAVRGPKVRSYEDILRVTSELVEHARRPDAPPGR